MFRRTITLLTTLLVSNTGFSDDFITAVSEPLLDQDSDGGKCYWMENYSGDYEWIPARPIWGSNRKIVKRECYTLDSCDGGLGHSGGGCYKWATGPKGERIAWEMQNEYSTNEELLSHFNAHPLRGDHCSTTIKRKDTVRFKHQLTLR